jgi:hypothetical protein
MLANKELIQHLLLVAFPLTDLERAVLMIADISILGGMFIWAFSHLEQLKQKSKSRFYRRERRR